MVKLNEIANNAGATKNRIRAGRGIGCGKGKTCGRGVKGQKSRSGGGVRPGFEGGQAPLYRRLPMRGFNNIFTKNFTTINVAELQNLVEIGRLKAGDVVTIDTLKAVGYTKKSLDGLKVLGNGELTTKLDITAIKATKSAVEKIEKAGGKITFPTPVEKVKKLPKKTQS